MLERRRRSQLRLEPLAAEIPTRTTTTRRTRRVCVNIETNGAGPQRSRRRRRRELLHPYFMTYPSVYGGNPWGYEWYPNESYYGYENFVDPLNRLNAGEGYECDPVDGFIAPEEETVQQCCCNNSGQKAISELKNILVGLESYLEEESAKKLESNVEPNPCEVPEDQNNQLPVLTDLMCDTIARLNNYMSAHSKKEEQMQAHQVRPPSIVPPVQVLQLPVQPLILPPMYPNPPPMYSTNYSSPLDSESSLQSKTHFERLPWLKERKRKRPSKSVTYVRLQSRGCSTEDLDVLPRLLEASNSRESSVPSKSLSPPMKDTGTTMWCPMECCRGCCGVVRSQEYFHHVQDKPPEASVVPSPMRITDHLPPTFLKAPPPTEDEMEGDPEKFYHLPNQTTYLSGSSPQRSSYGSCCDYRHAGGNLRYSYIEEEEEEKLQVDAEEEEDEWYRGASHKLAELELEQEYFKEMEKQTLGNTRNQQLQTDPDISSDNSSVNIIVTTDKAVSTTDLCGLTNRDPVKIIRIYKRSSLKQRQRLKCSNHKGKSKGSSHKVKFEKVQPPETVQILPERVTIGRNPMSSDLRCNQKRSSSSLRSKETRSYRDQ